MNAIGLQPRNPPTSVTSQGTQTLAPQLQNAETQTEREVQEQESTSAGTGEGEELIYLTEFTSWVRGFHIDSISHDAFLHFCISLAKIFPV